MFGGFFGGGEEGLSAEDKLKQVGNSLQEFTVLMEYQKLQEHPITDMYVFPGFESPNTWHGVLFLHEGLYSGGIFRFLIRIPSDYP